MADQLTRIENGIRFLLRRTFGMPSYEGLGLTEEQMETEIADDEKWRKEWIERVLNGEIKE